MIVAIEGGDACGKATQTRMLLERITNPCRLVSFPRYETAIGETVLSLLKRGPLDLTDPKSVIEHNLILQVLMNSDRFLFQHTLKSWEYERQALNDKGFEHVLVLDRWWQSGYVYGTVAGLPQEQIRPWIPMHRSAHLNILIDVPAAVAMERRPPRDKFEEKLSFREQVRQAYLGLWEEWKSGLDMWVVIDGTMPAQSVHNAIWEAYSAMM